MPFLSKTEYMQEHSPQKHSPQRPNTGQTGSLDEARLARPLLLFKAALFIALVPGAILVYIPLWIVGGTGATVYFPVGLAPLAGYALVLAGVGVYLRCAWDFVARGSGTPAPTDPPKHLVIGGLYRWTRNPMYHGVLAAQLAEAAIFESVDLLLFAAGTFVFFHLLVLLYEEPNLRRRFGAAYAAYCGAVPRWGVTLTPYRSSDRG